MARATRGARPVSRVLVITRNLPPLIGGMESLVWRLVEGLSAAYETRVIGPRGATGHKPSGCEVREVPHRPLIIFFLRALGAAIRSAVGWRPDAVVAGRR